MELILAGDKYINEIKPFPDSNLTLLDVWSYAYGDISESSRLPMEELSIPFMALKSCSLRRDEESCFSVERFNLELENGKINLWKEIQEGLSNDFIPLCSYGTTNLELNHCTEFKRIDQSHCFTFNESSFTHLLGKTEGLNFLVNYDYPGTQLEMTKPFTIILHEPGQIPDLNNVKSKNFYVRPGRMVDLKITTIVVDSTADFNEMSLESRLCNKDFEYGEVNCLMKHISDRAEAMCGCRPWYTKSMNHGSCDTLGTICYEKSMRNRTENINEQEKCIEPCQEFKYSMVLLEDLPMTDAIVNDFKHEINGMKFGSFGEDFNNLFLRSKQLIQYRGYYGGTSNNYDKADTFLQEKLKRATLIHINFEELKAWAVTKDAKITIPDMVGNIGGTLGVFIGLSFLGLLDDLVEFFQYLHQRRQN